MQSARAGDAVDEVPGEHPLAGNPERTVNLSTTIHCIRSTVRKYESHYQRARTGEPAFAPYATASALVAALAPRSPLTIEERQPIVRAAILAQQRATHPLWQGVLLGAFEPMLCHLRSRVQGIPADELDQRVLTAFLEAVTKVRVDGEQPVFIAVRRATARVLFTGVRKEQAFAELERFDDEKAVDAQVIHADPPQFVRLLAREAVGIMAQVRGGEDAARSIAGAETLQDQADRLGNQGVSYECVRKRRQRAIGLVRDEIEKVKGRPD